MNYDPVFDKWHEECGVFGVYDRTVDVARYVYWGLFALQHRGQESAGIAVTDGHDVCLLYTSPSPRDLSTSRMPSSA